MTDLRFEYPLATPPGNAVNLRLGGRSSGGVTRTLVARVSAPWRSRSGSARVHVRAPWESASKGVRAQIRAPWISTEVTRAQARAPWGPWGHPMRHGASAPWGSATPVAPSRARAPWLGVLAVSWRAQVVWGPGTPVQRELAAPWAGAIPLRHEADARWGPPESFRLRLVASWERATAFVKRVDVPWGDGVLLVGLGARYVPPPPPIVEPPPPGRYIPPPGDAVNLRFEDRLRRNTALVFGRRDRFTLIVPIREIYLMINSAVFQKVGSGEVIPCWALSMQTDSDSWTWGYSASVPYSAMPLLEPVAYGEPVEILATVNGFSVRLVVEGMSTERVFAQESLRITGRGRSAFLDEKYCAPSTFDNAGGLLSSQQIADQTMPFGWSVEWGLTAWPVPAGAWSHYGTPISALLAVASAGGAYVQPHEVDQIQRVLPLYPLPPWDWSSATPDFILPSDATTREAIEYADKPMYNRVYVRGTGQGITGSVKRAGTAGDLLAQMVVDPLITHRDAAAQRGLPILADVGRQARVTLRTPVFPGVGVVVPGKLVRYVDGAKVRIGISRGVSIDVQHPVIRQSIVLETHE